MEYSLYDFLKLIGSLGFFLYGMKLMSEALQKVAGERMRAILTAMTSNRLRGVLTGLIITAIIQSSSATTVMVVSFVNAGLLSLAQSIGVIMGANIGTTVTAWLISLLGFKVDINVFALPLIGLAIPFIFSKNARKTSIGQLIIGFAILFMGLAFLKNSVPDIKGNPEVLSFIAKYSSYGFGSILLFLITGTLLTVVIQSSSAVMALTLVMCFNGWINFEMAAAMVLGENIGTTITANLAALVVNQTAKRAARAHFLFNIIGVFLILLVFRPFLNMIDWFLTSIGQGSPFEFNEADIESHAVIPIALSVFHSFFNILNTSIQIWFLPQIVKVVNWMVPTPDDDDEIFKLKYIKTAFVSVDEISLVQAKNEISVYTERTMKMYSMLKELSNGATQKEEKKLTSKIIKYEEISDRIEEEIANFITQLSSKDLSSATSENINTLLKLVNRIESLNDAISNTADVIKRKKQKEMVFTEDMNERIKKLFEMTDELILEIPNQIKKKNAKIDVNKYRDKRNDIDNYIEKINLLHLKDIRKGMYKYKVGMVYCDYFNELENVGNHSYHILKYINELNL